VSARGARRHDATAVVTRHPRLRDAASALLLICLATAAQAGDAAARRIIGFSPDGNYFAFEQYGTLDWSDTHSGWSEIAIIDTRTDGFVGGKPITVVDESAEATLTQKQARQKAAALAAPLLAKYAIAKGGERIAGDKLTFPDETIAYGDIARVEEASQKWLSPRFDELRISTIQLDEILAGSATDCSTTFDEAHAAEAAGKARGFRLSLQMLDDAGIKILHEDKSVPASRKCPSSYSLSEAYAYKPAKKPAAIAVLVQRFSQGWEGRDRRFIAVTGQLP
jgi:predicted secreted protein